MTSSPTPQFLRATGSHPHFIQLVQALDADLAVRNGELNAFFSQYNKIEGIGHAVIAYLHDQPVGCGALKPFEPRVMEVKRMYVPPALRGQGIASQVLGALEAWAREMGQKACVLETGTMLPEAIRLYEKNGYSRIPNYGQYIGVAESVCFSKEL